MDKCKKEKENIYKTTCKDCEYNDNCENVTKKGEIKMTNFQKAIKVRKVCETKSKCEDCEYFVNCKKHFYLRFTPLDVNIEDLAKVINEEKWKIK